MPRLFLLKTVQLRAQQDTIPGKHEISVSCRVIILKSLPNET